MIEQPGEPVEMAAPLSMLMPVPIQTMTGVGSGPAGNFVISRYETPVGSFAFLLTPEEARKHGEDLIRRSATSATGIELPPGVRI